MERSKNPWTNRGNVTLLVGVDDRRWMMAVVGCWLVVGVVVVVVAVVGSWLLRLPSAILPRSTGRQF